MEVSSLSELYLKVQKRTSTVFVVPLIRFSFPKTDYLFLLYKDFFQKDSSSLVKSISALGHIRFVLEVILKKNTLLHYHWLEFQDVKSLIGMPYKLFCISLYKLFGGKIVWTVHNLNPHDKKLLFLNRAIHVWMAKRASLIHVHSNSSLNIVSEAYDLPKSKIVVLKHPRFPSEFINREQALSKFLPIYNIENKSLHTPTFLIFGGISEYKGIREIIEILISKKKPFSLIIAGYLKKAQRPLHRFIIQNTMNDERIIYLPTFIPEEHYPLLFSISDICVFNYDEILSSGGIEMALSYKKEIIAPQKGGIVDLVSPLISTFNSKKELELLIDEKLRSLNHA